MQYFPLFLNMQGKVVLIYGGGGLALQRVRKLMPFSPYIRVISREVCQQLKDIKNIEIIYEDFSPSQLEPFPSLVVLTEQEGAEYICEQCRKRGILVNGADMPELCDVFFPALHSGEEYCIAVSTGGRSPTAAMRILENARQSIPDNMDEIIEKLYLAREEMKKELSPVERKKALYELCVKFFQE